MKYAIIVATSLIVMLSGCASVTNKVTMIPADVVQGPKVTENNTPYSAALVCLDTTSILRGRDRVSVSVSPIADLTGKYKMEGTGNVITQGAQHMFYSALAKLPKSVEPVERADISISNYERQEAMKKLLGDGDVIRTLSGKINWRPVNSGEIRGSRYYITGAITEVNFNLQSGGAELGIDGIGGKGRKYVMNVAGDFRLVDTRSTEVLSTVSVQKQVVGYEVDADIFNFFGTVLVDFHSGVKNDEPVQLAVRSLVEYATARMISTINGGNPKCLSKAQDKFKKFYKQSIRNPEKAGRALAVGLGQGFIEKDVESAIRRKVYIPDSKSWDKGTKLKLKLSK